MFKLTAKKRDILGKKVDSLREAGELPAVVYGSSEETLVITLNQSEFQKVLSQAGESTIVSLTIDGQDQDVLIHDVQIDPLSGLPIHVDLYIISQDKELEVAVPLVFEGIALAVKDLGGSLVKVLHELEIRALPKNLPHDIVVDISSLVALDSQILIKDLKLPVGVESVLDVEEVVVAITEAGEEVIEEVAPVDLSAIEVEKKGKQEEATEEDEVPIDASTVEK